MHLSEHFTLTELIHSDTALRQSIDNHPSPSVEDNLQHLCTHILQPLRNHFGPILITSGYRCLKLNKAIGSKETSQHIKGQAADLKITGISPTEICQWVAQSSLPFDQVIQEGTWTHISWSKKPRKEVLTAHFNKNGIATYVRGIA